MLSPRSVKKELSKGQSFPEPKAFTTRAKASSKSKKPVESEDDAFDVERQFHEFVKSLGKQLLMAEMGTNKAVMEATDEAKACSARTVLQARIRMAQEPIDPDFNKSAWDVASWRQTLLKLGGEEEPKSVKTAEAGTNGLRRQLVEMVEMVKRVVMLQWRLHQWVMKDNYA
ncbi:hypothetical protein HanIR_Chr10g0461651 [Helianthus annuus]|nr:hypothetical protein HanIR_Chr10g0461651 [Helianthus annuus]